MSDWSWRKLLTLKGKIQSLVCELSAETPFTVTDASFFNVFFARQDPHFACSAFPSKLYSHNWKSKSRLSQTWVKFSRQRTNRPHIMKIISQNVITKFRREVFQETKTFNLMKVRAFSYTHTDGSMWDSNPPILIPQICFCQWTWMHLWRFIRSHICWWSFCWGAIFVATFCFAYSRDCSSIFFLSLNCLDFTLCLASSVLTTLWYFQRTLWDKRPTMQKGWPVIFVCCKEPGFLWSTSGALKPPSHGAACAAPCFCGAACATPCLSWSTRRSCWAPWSGKVHTCLCLVQFVMWQPPLDSNFWKIENDIGWVFQASPAIVRTHFTFRCEQLRERIQDFPIQVHFRNRVL